MTSSDVIEARQKHGGVPLLVIGILLIIVGSYSLVQNPQQFPTPTAVIVMGLVLAFLPRLQVWYLFKQNSKLQESLKAITTEDGIEVSSPTASTKYAWNGFIHFVETKNLFLVYRTKQVFNAFPKRAFTSDEVDDFRKLLEQKVGVVTMVKNKKISLRTWVLLAVVVIAGILLAKAILNIVHSTPSG